MQKQSKNAQLFFHYGQVATQLTPAQAAKLAHVGYKTALRWVNGTQKPNPATHELLMLKATKRVLPRTLPWAGIHITDDGLICLANGETFHPNEYYGWQFERAELHHLRAQVSRHKQTMAQSAYTSAALAHN